LSEAHPRFVRRRVLGSGGFGKVMRAYDLELGIEVALKRSFLGKLYDPAERARLVDAARTEAAAASRIAHPGIARVFGLLNEEGGDALLVEELIDGPSLREAMASEMALARKLDLLARIAFSLSAVHSAGVIHRDMKPDNVILRGGEAPVIVDFGISVLGPPSADQSRIGTSGYMAPEQGKGRAVPQSDLYALGSMAHELLTGERPDLRRTGAFPIVSSLWQRAGMRRRLAARLEPDVASLVAQMLAPHPLWRPATAAEVGRRFAEASRRTAEDKRG
jgi:serine/threonine-protein kinase